MPRLTRLSESLPATVPFTGPEALERRQGFAFRARLGANESLFGPSPKATAAMTRAAAEAWMYGDPEVHDLKAALAAHHGTTPGHIVAGEGIDGLLGLLVRLMISPGDPVVTSDGAYPTFNFHVAGFGGVLHKVPYSADHEDPEALLAKARETGARLLYLANPDNPMGSQHPAARIESLVAQLPDDTLLILDEAYADFAPLPLPRIDPDHPNVIRMRTFSKAYGLAGLRVGYAIAAPALAGAFDKVRNHFGLGRIAQAGALAALSDQDWIAHVRRQTEAARARLTRIAAASGLKALPSATNFVAVDCGADGTFARAVLAALAQEGVFVRMPGVAPLDRCIRVSVGPDSVLDILAEALPKALAATRR
jgi:histidinol-phosphate aminotransferase